MFGLVKRFIKWAWPIILGEAILLYLVSEAMKAAAN